MGSSERNGEKRRHTLLVNKPVQGRFLGLMVLIVVIVAVLSYVLTHSWKDGALVPIFAQSAGALLLVLFGVLYISLRYTQRVVGPLVAFGRVLSSIHQGNYSGAMSLRRHDHLQNLAVGTNQTMEALRQRVQEDMAFCDTLAGQVESAAGLNAESREALLKLIRQKRAAKEQHLMK